MMRRNVPLAVALIISMLFVGIVHITTPVRAKTFSLAMVSWTYPDEYGQGLQSIELVFSNGTTYDSAGWFWPYVEFTDFETDKWFFNTTLWVSVGSWVNATLVGFASWQEGLNYVRHSITISILGETMFSQQNFTYSHGLDEAVAPMYYYVHNISLSCFNNPGAIYKVEVDYEIFD